MDNYDCFEKTDITNETAKNSYQDTIIANKDYMLLGNTRMTPSQLKGRFESLKQKHIDLPLSQSPIFNESTRAIRSQELTSNEKFNYDHADYDLESPQNEKRFHSKFEYYEALLLALRSNISSALLLKRRMIAELNEVDIIKKQIVARSTNEYGKEMGTNEKQREAWLWWKYPALCEIHQMYEGIVEEIEIESERLDAFQRDTSRALSALESNTKVQNLSSNYK